MAKQPSENPTYKLTYFNVKALGEPIRLLFAYGGIQYEDVRVEYEQWPQLKPTTPMGQLPMLDIDGIRVHQNIAIARYIAKKVHLTGKNDWEDLQIDIVVDIINDLRIKLADIYMKEDRAIVESQLPALIKDVVPKNLGKLDEIAKENDGFLALGRLTWIDVYLLGVLNYLNIMMEFDLTEKYPNLKRVITNASNVDSIKAWLEKRPKPAQGVPNIFHV